MTQPAPKKPLPPSETRILPAQINTRVSPAGKAILSELAKSEGITLQQLGVFAWNLALHAYGRGPLPEDELLR